MAVLGGVLYLRPGFRICEDARDGALEGWPRLESGLEVALGFGPVEVGGNGAVVAAAVVAVAVVEAVEPVVGTGRVIVVVEPGCNLVEVEDIETDNGIEAGAGVVVVTKERIAMVGLAAELVEAEYWQEQCLASR